MSFVWPEFEDKQHLEGHRSWTATFESYDQRTETCYYRVSLYDGLRPVAELVVEVGTELVGDDWSGFANELRSRIARAVATGSR